MYTPRSKLKDIALAITAATAVMEAADRLTLTVQYKQRNKVQEIHYRLYKAVQYKVSYLYTLTVTSIFCITND